MTLKKYRESSNHQSKINYLVKKVDHNIYKKEAKREKIIGPKKYRRHLLELQQLERAREIEKDHQSKRTRKSSKSDNNKALILIKSQGLDTVSRESIQQEATILDKDKYLKPIIKMGDLVIPEMELDLSNKEQPTVSFPTLIPKSKNNEKNKSINDSYIIAIPSYNRPDLIQVKTLALLHRHEIPASKITIFVANQEQHDLYKKKIPEWLYGNLVVGVLGLRNQRNFIMDYYPEETHIVQMDDDLNKIMELIIQPRTSKRGSRTSRRSSRSTRQMRPIINLDEFIKNAFEICHDKGIFLWGVYPLANARFMTPKMTTDLRFIVGPFWGIINRQRPDLRITIDEKENAERTLQHYTIDGAVLRFNNVGIETRYYKNKGGMQDEGKDRKEEARKSVYYLHKKYPKLTKIYLGKKSGVPEIRMLAHPH
jgi:hypothetical protein